MDVMSLLNGGAVVGSVTQANNTSTTSTNGVDFQKQLVSVVGAQQGEVTQAAKPLIASVAELLPITEGNLDEQLITLEELNEILEQLMDQLDELAHLELGGEQLAVVDSLLQQIQALIQVISLNGDSFNQSLSVQPEAQQLDGSDVQSLHNHAVIKLQDQLLLLQQALQSGMKKVLSGQTVEKIVSEQLHLVQVKVNELVQDVKLKQLTNQAGGDAKTIASLFAASDAIASEADQATHLQRMGQNAAYAQAGSQAAAQVSEAAASATLAQAANEEQSIQPATSIAMLRADNARELLPHIVRSGAAVTSAYVLADEFAETMKGLIVQRFNITELNGLTEARLSLTPEHLGHVDVKISMQNGVLTAMFQTETAMAKDALENQMLQLRATLAAQGITVEKIEVTQSAFASQLSQQQKQHSQNGNSNEGNASRKEHEEAFEEELLLNATNHELGFGRAVNETV